MPGCRNWCKMWGLDDDYQLRDNVLASLDNSPDGTILIDGICIYQDDDGFFSSDGGRGMRMKDKHYRSLHRKSVNQRMTEIEVETANHPRDVRHSDLVVLCDVVHVLELAKFFSDFDERQLRSSAFKLNLDENVDQYERFKAHSTAENFHHHPGAHKQRIALGDIASSQNDNGWIAKYFQTTPVYANTGASTPLELFSQLLKAPSTHTELKENFP
ncbi:hypothetical protein BJ878DRAFT_575623 [Calycina marina]|uniref:Uncharacterized protein n=1 Tax=Calycina marina TaxID=1763456 RepID=A0A9P7Z375_9HELO|nr:hypothetical protein BJ878DRAFT_575623 [Calycina marina]